MRLAAALFSLTLSLSMLENLALTPAYFALGVAAHESAHAAAIKASGYEVASFKPYPHKESGVFYFGTTTYGGENRTLINAAPMLLDLALISAADLAMIKIKDHNARLFLATALMIVPLIDFAYNINNRSSKSDLSGLSKNSGISKTKFQITGNIIALIEAFRIYQRLQE
jgi:hypothetical protein